MGGRIVLIGLICLAIAFAPAAAAEPDPAYAGTCVWTSSQGTSISFGVNPKECLGTSGSWFPASPS